jgi:protein JSN1
MRACLESHHASKDQQRMLAAAIALHSVQLATNANGALLLTWFLDTCTFPQRRTVLSPQLVPYLVHLCTHKVAYLTVLKVINQKAEAEARDTILTALFFTASDQVLEAILSDHACGATLIFKVLTTPFFDETMRSQVVETVKSVLVRIKAQPGQGYKRLMDEVGLSTRNSNTGGGGGARDHGNSERQRPGSRQTSSAPHHHHTQQQQQHAQQQAGQYGEGNNPQYYNPLNAAAAGAANYETGFGIPRSEGVDQFPPFNAQGPMYSASNPPAMGPNALQQMRFQQDYMSRGAQLMPSYYPVTMQAGYGGYQSPSPSLDQYRAQPMTNSSPIPQNAIPLPAAGPGAPYGASAFMGPSPGFVGPYSNPPMHPGVPPQQVNSLRSRGRGGRSPQRR